MWFLSFILYHGLSSFFYLFLCRYLLSAESYRFANIDKYVVYRYRALFLLWTKVKVQLSQADAEENGLNSGNEAMPGQSLQIMCGIKLVWQSWKCFLYSISLSLLSPFSVLYFVVSQALDSIRIYVSSCRMFSAFFLSSQSRTKCFLLLKACFFLTWMFQTLVGGIYLCRGCL